jgi:hypothetical protein
MIEQQRHWHTEDAGESYKWGLISLFNMSSVNISQTQGHSLRLLPDISFRRINLALHNSQFSVTVLSTALLPLSLNRSTVRRSFDIGSGFHSLGYCHYKPQGALWPPPDRFQLFVGDTVSGLGYLAVLLQQFRCGIPNISRRWVLRLRINNKARLSLGETH